MSSSLAALVRFSLLYDKRSPADVVLDAFYIYCTANNFQGWVSNGR